MGAGVACPLLYPPYSLSRSYAPLPDAYGCAPTSPLLPRLPGMIAPLIAIADEFGFGVAEPEGLRPDFEPLRTRAGEGGMGLAEPLAAA
jgi:hypothetical protein